MVRDRDIKGIGIDPTLKGGMGWAVVAAGGVLQCGELTIPKNADQQTSRELQATTLRQLFLEHQPQVITIEHPIFNSEMLDRYEGTDDMRKIAGAARATLDLGIAVGYILNEAQRCNVIVAQLLNPGSAKRYATGRVGASKKEVIEAARLLIAERDLRAGIISDHTQVKKPSEHTAHAVFIGLEGVRVVEYSGRLLAAQAQYDEVTL